MISPKTPKSTRSSLSNKSPQFKKIMKVPLSPHLRPPSTIMPQSKIDVVEQSYSSVSGKKLKEVPDFIKNNNTYAIDLEDNDLNCSSLSGIPSKVISLNLNRNPLKEFAIPSFDSLRTLFLENCSLTSFLGMPFFPNLQCLSLSGNKISSFNGMKIMPKLESINILGNTSDFPVVTSIAAIGSIYLRTFNNRTINHEELSKSFIMSPLVGIALRKGRSIVYTGKVNDENARSLSFLLQPLKDHCIRANIKFDSVCLKFEKSGNFQFLTPSIMVEDPVWYRNCDPIRNPNEWEPIPLDYLGEEPNKLPITNFIRLHLIKCTFKINDASFSLFSEVPIGIGAKEHSLPYPLDPVIAGQPHEGSLLSLLPIKIPVRVAWLCNDSLIAKDKVSILITEKEVEKQITCLLSPYCEEIKEIVFSTIVTQTDIVQPLYPMVSGVSFPDFILEDKEVTFSRVLVPEREGKSQIIIERSPSPSGDWEIISLLEPQSFRYTPVSSDVGCFLRISYCPMTTEGIVGEIEYFYSLSRVLPSIPSFRNVFIAGIPKVGHPQIAMADYIGGTHSNCQFNWFISQKQYENVSDITSLEPVLTGNQVFIPNDSHIGFFVAVELIPIRDDEVVGDASYCYHEQSLMAEFPIRKINLSSKSLFVGQVISFPEEVQVYFADRTQINGFRLVYSGNEWKPTKSDIGKVVRIASHDIDMVLGEVYFPSPKLCKVSLIYDTLRVGSKISVKIDSINVKNKNIEVIWVRKQGSLEKAVCINQKDYLISDDDIGSKIRTIATLFDNKGTRLYSIESEASQSIKPIDIKSPRIIGTLMEGERIGFDSNYSPDSITWLRSGIHGKWSVVSNDKEYLLSAHDVGKFIRVQLKRNHAQVSVTTTDTVQCALPSASVCFPKDVYYENDLIRPSIKYHGGNEGKSEFKWEKRKDSQTINVNHKALEYYVMEDDIDHEIVFTYFPIRKDGIKGNQVSISTKPILPQLPSVSSVTIFQNNEGDIEVSGKYNGGKEGESLYVWRMYTLSGMKIISTTNKKVLPLIPQYYNRIIECEYNPIRDDEMRGLAIVSQKLSIKPLPVIQDAAILAKNGQILSGNPLRVTFKCNEKNVIPTFQWQKGNGQFWIPINNSNNIEYCPTEDDVSYLLSCLLTVVDSSGWRSKPFIASTSITVMQGKATVSIDGIPELGSTLTAKTNPSTKITWQRGNEKVWSDIIDCDTYSINANDCGFQIRACANGAVSKPTPLIEVPKLLNSYINATFRSKAFQFNAYSKISGSSWIVKLSPTGISMVSSSGNEKTAKWDCVLCTASYTSLDEIKIVLDKSCQYILSPLNDDPRLGGYIPKDSFRDFIICLINRFTFYK